MFGSFLSFAGGFSRSFIGSMYINNHDHNSVTNKLDINELLLKSTIMGLFNIVGGVASGISSTASSMGKISIELDSKFALGLLAGIIAGGSELFYDLIYFITDLLMKVEVKI